MSDNNPGEPVLQALDALVRRYEVFLQDPELPLGDLLPLRALDNNMRAVAEQALALAQSAPRQAPLIQQQLAQVAALNRQILDKVEQGRETVAAQLDKLGKARKGVGAYAANARLSF
ncbi:MAG: hypothetical protein WBN40_05315 [Pseudomonadales bacterium]